VQRRLTWFRCCRKRRWRSRSSFPLCLLPFSLLFWFFLLVPPPLSLSLLFLPPLCFHGSVLHSVRLSPVSSFAPPLCFLLRFLACSSPVFFLFPVAHSLCFLALVLRLLRSFFLCPSLVFSFKIPCVFCLLPSLFFLVYLHPPCRAWLFPPFSPLRSVPLSTVFSPPFHSPVFLPFSSLCRFSFSGFYNQRMPCSRMDFNAIKHPFFFFFRVKKMNSVNVNGYLRLDPWHFEFLQSSPWVLISCKFDQN